MDNGSDLAGEKPGSWGWRWDTLVQNMQKKKVLSHPNQFFHLVEKDGSIATSSETPANLGTLHT